MTRITRAWSHALLTLATIAIVASGCGSDPYKTVTVRGRVTTCEGKPAVGGTVIFTPIDAPQETGRPAGNPGRISTGTVGEDGTFTLAYTNGPPGSGAVTGPHRVTFIMPPTTRPVIDAETRAAFSPEELVEIQRDFDSRPVYPPLPCSAEITPGEVKVAAGDNMFEFKLPPKAESESAQ
jgi:hypothetical protein